MLGVVLPLVTPAATPSVAIPSVVFDPVEIVVHVDVDVVVPQPMPQQ
jgi:hypothetical protein